MNVIQLVKRRMVFLTGLAIILGGSYFLFVYYPTTSLELMGTVLLLVSVAVGGVGMKKLASSVVPEYNVGQITIDGTIAQTESSDLSPVGGNTTGAESIVEQVNAADENSNVKALLVKINTGGIVPSEDIRRALEEFDGPTVAYATEVCASGGYWVASGCDEIWAHKGSMVGSIGVKFSQVRFADLAEKVGVSYESITSGEYKEIMTKFKELEPHEREQLQGITDSFYDIFVEQLDESLELERETIEATEAKVYVGPEARENGMVDNIGYESEVKDRLANRLGEEVVVTEFGDSGVVSQLAGGAHSLAYSFGAGLGTGIGSMGGSKFEF
ncbi:signal peptide peptidase SppA [Halomicrobium mukohataei]|uniref:Signal peptide peptidase SppA n=1 Tax=Halomicrobium mukohataei TaxID=57705 RepID=A0A847U0L6_9EURY|nr:S49 family peptidase [Halomicrobium mukohataei]NLV09143.1 signal peptide peptidase SppA [Halomicrobium mukohataei]